MQLVVLTALAELQSTIPNGRGARLRSMDTLIDCSQRILACLGKMSGNLLFRRRTRIFGELEQFFSFALWPSTNSFA